MNRHFLVITMLFLLCAPFSVNAQLYANHKEKKQKTNYISFDSLQVSHLHVFYAKRFLSRSIVGYIDFGQQQRLCFSKKSKIRNKDRKKIIFNSEIALIEAVSKQGFQYLGYDSYSFAFKKKDL